MRYVIDAESFEPRDVFECGQCFRWNKEDDDSYTGIFGNYIVNVKKENDKIIIDGNFEDTSEIDSYFDLKRNYNVIKSILANVDDNLKNSIQYGNGIRMERIAGKKAEGSRKRSSETNRRRKTEKGTG